MKATFQLELTTLTRPWIEDVKANFWKLANRGQISADDVHEVFGEPPHNSQFGGLFAKLKQAGMIREVGRVRSKRPERNGAKVSLWKIV